MSRPPKKIKFGPFEYTILPIANLDGGSNFGKYVTTTKQVMFDPTYSEQVSRETIMHELLHLILDDVFVVPDELEEILVSTLSPRIMELLKRNPKLTEYLLEK